MKDAFARKFFGAGREFRWRRARISSSETLYRFFGNTLLKAGHLMRSSVVSGTVRGLALGTGTCRPDSERFRSTPRTCRRFRCILSLR